MTSGSSSVLPGTVLVQRHSALVRVTHWLNVLCLTVLLLSGLQIFNAHPPSIGANTVPTATTRRSRSAPWKGRRPWLKSRRIGGLFVPTTGVLGASEALPGN